MAYSQNGDFERLVEQITDVIVARLNGGAEDGACGCGRACFNRCPERMQRVVDAGASRIGILLGEGATARDWASMNTERLARACCWPMNSDRRCGRSEVSARSSSRRSAATTRRGGLLTAHVPR